MTQTAGEKDDAHVQRAQVFCSICKKSMAVEVPVPEFCDCPHCGAHFPASGELSPKTPSPPLITPPQKHEPERQPPNSQLRPKSNPDPSTPDLRRREEMQTLPDPGSVPPPPSDEAKQKKRALLVAAGFVIVAAASFAGGILSRDEEDEAIATASEESKQLTNPPSECVTQKALVANTGNFQGAKLRAQPGFEHPQASIITKGAHITVCERVETPGKKAPHVWLRIADGKHKGLWIHGNTLDLK